MRPGLKIIGWTSDLLNSSRTDVGVDLRGTGAPVFEELLNVADINSRFVQMGRITMP